MLFLPVAFFFHLFSNLFLDSKIRFKFFFLNLQICQISLKLPIRKLIYDVRLENFTEKYDIGISSTVNKSFKIFPLVLNLAVSQIYRIECFNFNQLKGLFDVHISQSKKILSHRSLLAPES